MQSQSGIRREIVSEERAGKVVAIGIDGPNGGVLADGIRQGHLPVLKTMAEKGTIYTYTHQKRFRNERCWDIFLGGHDSVDPGSTFVPETYEYFNKSPQRNYDAAPFYALGDNYRVCMFDLPATQSDLVNGIQVSGWGSELNVSRPSSTPETLITELTAQYGADPKLVAPLRVLDHGTQEEELSYVVPSLYDPSAVNRFRNALLASIGRRTEICLDLLGREEWDLFLSVYPEIHSANHTLWHLGEEHPLADLSPNSGHAQLEILQAIDTSIGRIMERIPPDRELLIYTLDETTRNSMDVPTMALLPELLFRWNFMGERALADGDVRDPAPAPRTDYTQHWKHEVWALRTDIGDQRLESPRQQESEGDPLSWNPANWYRPLWPGMKAFSLPSVSDGYIRLNVKGREGTGVLEPDEYEATLLRLEKMLRRTKDPRTGELLVKELVRTRRTPMEHPDIPPDLVVCWNDSISADTMDSPELGRIGPLPFFRTGGHVSHGTLVHNQCFACGPGIARGKASSIGGLHNLSDVILELVKRR